MIGAGWLARECGFPKVLSLDIGGTSADFALIIDGEPQYGTGEMIGEFPLYIPSVSVSSIGIGGGTGGWNGGIGGGVTFPVGGGTRTVTAALGIVRRLLDGPAPAGGYYTPSKLMGADYVLSLPDVRLA